MTIPISSCQMSLSPTPEHPRGRRRRRRKFSSTTLTLLILTTFSFKISWADKVPVPDDCSSSPYEDGLALECSLSAINSVDEKTNFSVVPSDHTLALTVKCREPTLSQLEADGFRSLRHLKRLVLDGCNLKVIPSRAFWGLDKLESLTVWTRQAGVLTIDRAAFFGLGNLLRLDLSGNYIRFLPPEALCPLPRLQTLNLSHNEVGSLSDIGADSSKGCISSLSSVDLSYNELSGLTTRQMSSMTSLNEIWLGHNYIRSVDPDIFRASSDKLNFVDLSNNQLSNLPAELFAGARNLERVSLANNTLNQLSDKMFASQQRRLQVVDLSGNLLRSIGESLLKNQTSLTSLDLGYNELESLKPGTFSDLKSLQFLKMDHNRLTRFSPDLFASLTQLHTFSESKPDFWFGKIRASVSLEIASERKPAPNHQLRTLKRPASTPSPWLVRKLHIQPWQGCLQVQPSSSSHSTWCQQAETNGQRLRRSSTSLMAERVSQWNHDIWLCNGTENTTMAWSTSGETPIFFVLFIKLVLNTKIEVQ